ncbi:MAG: S66 peptidase family protein [Candidatus Binataceae bacterium]
MTNGLVQSSLKLYEGRLATVLAKSKMTASIIKPLALHAGDTVGVVAPAAAIEREYLDRGVNALISMGYRVKVSPHALDRDGVLAGPDSMRAAELMAFFANPEIKAVFGARGGYGCGRILPLLDFDALRRTRKVFLGFSDATFILNALVELGGLVCFHGPMVAMDFSKGLTPRASEHLKRLLNGETREFELDARETLRPGVAEGELIGGCLSVIVAMLATPFCPEFDGRVLFLEDTGEKAYRIDRMLVQMRQAGILHRVAGVVFGALRPFSSSEDERALIKDFVLTQTRDLSCPVLFGIEAGHGTENLTLPLGVRVRLDGSRRKMTFLELAVE